jgi:excisionase family DNA binding protein
MTTALAEDGNRDNHEGDDMLSIDEAAEFLRVPVATLRYWRHIGEGPFSFRIGRHVRYWRTDLVIWRADQGRRPEPPMGA